MKSIFSQLFLFFLVLSLASSIASACQGGEDKPPNSLKKAYNGASIVFIGTVASIDLQIGKDVAATFEVVRSWKPMKIGKISFPIETCGSSNSEYSKINRIFKDLRL